MSAEQLDFWRSAARDAGTKTAQPSPAPVAQAGGFPAPGGGGRGVGACKPVGGVLREPAKAKPFAGIPRRPGEGKIVRDKDGCSMVIYYDQAAVDHVARRIPWLLPELLEELERNRT